MQYNPWHFSTKESFDMKTAVIQIRLDADLKSKAEEFFAEMGLNATSGMRFILKQCLRHRRLPFMDVAEEDDPFYSEANQKALREAIQRIEEGKYTVRGLIEA
jgi:DNA-damage-inducible protein J